MEDVRTNDLSAGARLLSSEDAKILLDSTDVFIFDCDGVIWKGDKLIEGVAQTMEMLRSMGKKLVFVTNNSTKSRRQYAKKFERVGLIVNEEEIFSSSFAASVFLESINFPKQKKVYVIGEEGISEELQLIGLTCLGGTVGAVVVGLDQYINYYKIHYATLCIRENPGCLFIATNQDASGHMTDMQEWPGAGAMVGAIRGATQKEPIVVGKPSQLMMKLLLQRFQTDASKMCMVGDRLDTDILFGLDGGCKTLLVLSGVTTLAGLNDPSNKIHPDYYTEKVSNLMELV
ncbi:unnamed protein product [Victoria cruziana]